MDIDYKPKKVIQKANSYAETQFGFGEFIINTQGLLIGEHYFVKTFSPP